MPERRLVVTPELSIPFAEIVIRATPSSGPGGQHVNRSATRIEAVWNVAASPALSDAQLVVVMGSPDAAYDDTLTWLAPEIAYVQQAIDAQVPVLGVCFGGQLLARVLGGSVRKSEYPEYGFVDVETSNPALVASGPWMEFHGDSFVAPPEATVITRNAAAQQAFVCGPHLGLQFHPEIDLDTYDAWAAAWDRDGVEHAVDVHEIRQDIADSEAAARARCSALLDAFLARSSAVPR